MSESDIGFCFDGSEPRMAERDLCIAVGEDLTKHYPGYDWLVGTDLTAGTVVIDLPPEMKPPEHRQYAYMLHASTLMGPGGHQRVMQAAGEILERMRLRRGEAPEDYRLLAQANGLDISQEV